MFEMWAEREDCQTLVEKIWATHIVGCPMLVLQRKLKFLKTALREWNIDKVGNIQDQISSLQLALNEVQTKLQQGHSEDLVLQEQKL